MIQITKCIALLFALLALAACNADESATATPPEEVIAVTEAIVEPSAGNTLVGSDWLVEDILAAGVIDRARTTIGFTEDGRVVGSGGCNRYFGGFELDGDGISFGPMAGTKMACPEALMNQDDRFHQALGQVVRWQIDPQTGLLHLQDQSGTTVIRASELAEGEQA